MSQINRREFLSTAAAATALFASGVYAGEAAARPIRLGLIGCGDYGMRTLVPAAQRAGGTQIVAVCDVDSDRLSSSAATLERQQGSRPAPFKMYDEMIRTAEMEAVLIATPTHWHALPLIAAVEKGLDVYCEKPLCYDPREGRAMVEAVRKSGRVVQIGFQRRQAGGFTGAREFIKAGSAGRIVQVQAQINYNAQMRDATPVDPPAALDWDLWCGPAPKIPYSAQVGHYNWRFEKTTGRGHMYDWGLHLIDQMRWTLGEKAPRSVTAAGGTYVLKDRITTPDSLTVAWDLETCPLTWQHRMWGAAEFTPEVNNGIFYYGERATVFATDDRFTIINTGRGANRETRQGQAANAAQVHMADFLTAVRERKPTACPIEDAYLSTLYAQLAMIAYESGTKVTWDAATEQIPNNPAAAALLKRDYRAPWKHPYAG
jgi:predicted dehydrogenase